MAKLESNLKNMVLSLVLISMGMSAALGYVYVLTKGPIEIANKQKEVEAVKKVLPEFDNDPVKEMKVIEGLSFYPATKGGQPVGCAVNTFTEKAFSGRFTLMVGFLPDGKINKTVVLEQKETPGLGTKMKEPKFYTQFEGKDPAQFKMTVKKDGGEVDAISAATISSRAYCDALNKAYASYMKNFMGQIEIVDASANCDTIKCEITDKKVLEKVLPAFDNKALTEKKSIGNIDVFTASLKGKIVGYAIKTASKGYNENIWLLTGFLADGTINNICVLRQKETVGRGSEITDDLFLKQFKGKNPLKYKLKVKAKGGDVDAISGSTISTEAFCDAVAKAFETYKKEK